MWFIENIEGDGTRLNDCITTVQTRRLMIIYIPRIGETGVKLGNTSRSSDLDCLWKLLITMMFVCLFQVFFSGPKTKNIDLLV